MKPKLKFDLNKLNLAVINSAYSVNEIADRSGLSRGTVSRVLNNNVDVTYSTVGKIAKALGVRAEEIM
jgi:transcriptional regulator with XRE-family HTH domain